MHRLTLALVGLLATGTVLASDMVIHAGTLLTVAGEDPLSEQTIVVKDGRIVEVVGGYQDPDSGASDAVLVDLKDQFVLPGLMDMHVHLMVEVGPNTRARQMTDSNTLAALRGASHARATLRAGFTTVRDLGARPESIYALRDAIARGYVEGPRIFAAGSALAATGGHGDVDGLRPELLELWTPQTICDGPFECRKAVRHAVKYGADWIKVTATGGVLSDTGTGLNQQMTDDELVEIMDTAHSLGVKVAAHAHGTTGVNAALRAGVDTIDHGSFLDKESMKLFKANGAHLVPTLMPGHFIPAQMAGNPFFTPDIIEKALQASAAAKGSFRLALNNGVQIAFGTDTGVTPHGMNAKEFELMVQEGMSPGLAIRSATVVTAELLGIADDVGTIEVGKFADMIAVANSPLQDITELQRVRAVIKDGELFVQH